MTTILDFASSAYSLQNDGWLITIGTVSLTAMLELVSLKHVKSICESESGRKLYLQGVLMNFLNNIVLGPLAYQLVNEFFMAKECPSAFSQCVMVLGILFGQALGYYLAHRWMHTPAMPSPEVSSEATLLEVLGYPTQLVSVAQPSKTKR